MAQHNELGKKGEEIAKQYLQKKGFKVIENNWRFGKDEIDIIVTNTNYLIVVEVKTRTSDYFGEPETAVTKTKQKFLIRAAQEYVVRKNIDKEVRFDIVSVLLNNETPKITHIEEAFYPTL